ncbi:chromatin-binding protein [Martiniozyma asiatica (nom. inval.)]|nr:chromatin-binding protein [Martiniozyma asiatica]
MEASIDEEVSGMVYEDTLTRRPPSFTLGDYMNSQLNVASQHSDNIETTEDGDNDKSSVGRIRTNTIDKKIQNKIRNDDDTNNTDSNVTIEIGNQTGDIEMNIFGNEKGSLLEEVNTFEFFETPKSKNKKPVDNKVFQFVESPLNDTRKFQKLIEKNEDRDDSWEEDTTGVKIELKSHNLHSQANDDSIISNGALNLGVVINHADESIALDLSRIEDTDPTQNDNPVDINVLNKSSPTKNIQDDTDINNSNNNSSFTYENKLDAISTQDLSNTQKSPINKSYLLVSPLYQKTQKIGNSVPKDTQVIPASSDEEDESKEKIRISQRKILKVKDFIDTQTQSPSESQSQSRSLIEWSPKSDKNEHLKRNATDVNIYSNDSKSNKDEIPESDEESKMKNVPLLNYPETYKIDQDLNKDPFLTSTQNSSPLKKSPISPQLNRRAAWKLKERRRAYEKIGNLHYESTDKHAAKTAPVFEKDHNNFTKNTTTNNNGNDIGLKVAKSLTNSPRKLTAKSNSITPSKNSAGSELIADTYKIFSLSIDNNPKDICSRGISQIEENNDTEYQTNSKSIYQTQVIAPEEKNVTEESSSSLLQQSQINQRTEPDGTTCEVPNTSNISGAQMGSFLNRKESSVISNEISQSDNNNTVFGYLANIDKNKQLTIQEKLNESLKESTCQKPPDEKENANPEIIRKNLGKIFSVAEVLDNSCVFINTGHMEPYKIVGFTNNKFGNVLFKVKNEGENEQIYQEVDPQKVSAPICFDIGDSVKYRKNKRSNYIITGLSKEKPINGGINLETCDGFNVIYIKKKKSGESEIKVHLLDIYIPNSLRKRYNHLIFDKKENFDLFFDYQIQKFSQKMEIQDPVKFNGDTLANDGIFGRCVFLLTGLNNGKPKQQQQQQQQNHQEQQENQQHHGYLVQTTPQVSPRHKRIASDEEDPYNIRVLTKFLLDNGAHVIEDNDFQEIIPLNNINTRLSPRKSNQQNGLPLNCAELDALHEYLVFYPQHEHKRPIRFDPKWKEIEFICVLSQKHSRTMKYLQALCLKWPVIHAEFIHQCMNSKDFLKNWRENWMSYVLPAGEVKSWGCTISSNLFKWYDIWSKGGTLKDMLNLNEIFKGANIIVVNDEPRQLMKWRLKGQKRQRGNVHLSARKRTMKRTASVLAEEHIEESSSEDSDVEETIDGIGSNNRAIEDKELLWIFTILGFKRVVFLKRSLNEQVIKRITNEIKDPPYVYFKMNNLLECSRLLESILGPKSLPVVPVNKEWLFQCIITGKGT